MRLSELVETSEGGLVPLGPPPADPQVDAVITTDLLDPRRYLSGGELVLTGLAWWQPDLPGRTRAFVDALVAGGAVALAAGDAQLGSVPADLVEACAGARLPLLRVPVAYSFAAVTERAVRHLSGHDDLGAVLARHRAFIAALAEREPGGSGLHGVLGLVAADLGLRCWVLSPTGRLLAGAGPPGAGPSAGPALPGSAPPSAGPPAGAAGDGEAWATVARQFLRAPRLPEVTRLPDVGIVSAVAAGPGPPAPRAACWILAVAGDHTTWTAERRTLVTELASLVALEADLSRRPSVAERQLGEALTAGSAAEVERSCQRSGFDPAQPSVAVVATGPMASVVLTEALSTDWLLAPAVSGVIAIGRPDGGPLVDNLADTVAKLRPALGPAELRIGVSDAVTGGAGLLGAVAEARAAALTADLSTPYSVAGPERLASHALLLAAVPVELREAYRARVLGPLLEHDRLHRTELVRTLRMYLDSSGSWSRCAAQMHVHVNTLRYRIERIEALTGRNLRHLHDQADLLIALNLP